MSLSKETKDIGSVPTNICPVTGLPILRRPEWTDVSLGKDYKLTVSILGDSIILHQPSGYITLQDAENTVRFSGKVVTEIITGGRPYVHISDYSNLKDASLEARKYYIDDMKKRDRLLGLIFYGASPMVKISIKLGKRLNIVKFNVQIVNDYAEAVKLAIKMLSHGKIIEDKPIIVSAHNKKPIRDALPTEKESICPITGLPITTKPEWTDIDIAENYSVSFSLIGNAILCTVPNGIPNNTGTHRLLEEREKVLREVGLLDKRYAEIRDHSRLSGRPSKESRMMLTNLLLKETNEGKLLGFWVFNASLFIRLMFDVGTKLHKSSAPVAAVKDYKEAVENAVNVLDQNGINFGTRQYKRFAKDDWVLELENYGIRFELIENDIIYTIAHGVMKETYLERFFKLNEKVLNETGLTAKGYYYRIINWEKFRKSTWKARRMYIDGLKDLNKKVPCKFSVLFGLNKFMSTIVGISKQFVPVSIATAKDLEEALAIIEREKRAETEPKIAKKGKKPLGKAFTEEQIRKHSEELLQFIGAIDWDQEGVLPENISDSHPFKPVFDAIAIVKNDLDDLFQERKRTEEALRESEDKYRTILESIEEGYYEVDIAGNFTFFNDSICKIFGYTNDELMGMNNRQYTDKENAKKLYETFNEVYKIGKPEKGFNWEIIRKDYTKRYVEASVSLMKDAEDKQIGFRGIVRDVTERKQAEAQLTASLKEKEVLLKEVHHRVKNNLQVISSLLSLQSQHIKDKEYMEMFKESQNRVWSMSLIHEKLYQSKDLSRIDMNEYTKDLTTSLFRSYADSAAAIKLKTKIGDISLDITTAIPCGLIINELTSNSLKHGFPNGRQGGITITMHPVNNKIVLVVSDTGVGFPKGIDFRNTTTLGIQLVITLVEQLEGTIELDRRAGSTFTICFEKLTYKKRI